MWAGEACESSMGLAWWNCGMIARPHRTEFETEGGKSDSGGRLNKQRWPYGAFSYRNSHVAQLVRPACQEGCFGANGLRAVTAREE